MHYFLVGKRVFVCLFFAVVMWSASESFAAINEAGISIDVKVKCEKDKDADETELESEDNLTITSFQTEIEIYTLHIELKNDGDQEYKGVLKWCFISDHSSGRNIDDRPEKAVPITFSPGKKAIRLLPGAELSESVVSEPFVYEEKEVETEWYIGDGGTSEDEYETGDVYQGYILMFVVNGKVLARTSSSNRYLKDEWTERFRTVLSDKQ